MQFSIQEQATSNKRDAGFITAVLYYRRRERREGG
jgi:hypothetical protein